MAVKRRSPSRRAASAVRNQRKRESLSSSRGYITNRFPTDAQIMLGELNGKYSRVRLSPELTGKANRWKENYLKSLATLMENTKIIGDAETLDSMDELYWKIVDADISKFLKAQDMYPQELSIRANYDQFSTLAAYWRTYERWNSVL